MARKPMITRTILSTKVVTLALNVETSEPSNATYNLSGTYKDERKLLKAVQNAFDTETLKNVHIVSSEQVETLYGMDENDFLKYAVELDPKSRKPINSETDEIADTEVAE